MSALNFNILVSAVPPSLIDLVWKQVAPLIDRVAEKAPDDIVTSVTRTQLIDGDRLLVIAFRKQEIIAVNVVHTIDLASGIRVLYVPIVAGDDIDLWLEPMYNILCTIAKQYECTELRGLVIRKGWLKKLEAYGYKEKFTTVSCQLGD